MKITHKELCSLYQSHIMEKRLFPSEKCPSLALLIHYIALNKKDIADTKIAYHILECGFCLRRFSLLIEIHQGTASLCKELEISINTSSSNQLSKKNSSRLTFLPKLLWNYMVLFFGIFLLSASLLLLIDRFRQENFNKSSVRENNQMAIKIVEPINVHIKKNNLQFKWNQNPQIEYYILEIYDENLCQVWESPRIIENYVSISSKLADYWQSNKIYLWLVTGYLKAGYAIESPLCEFYLID